MQPIRTGLMIYSIDTGQLLAADKFVHVVNWASGVDLKTGGQKVRLGKVDWERV